MIIIMNPYKNYVLPGLLAIAFTALLAGCGGGSSSSSGGTAAPASSGGTVSGTVTGFGSIVVDGQEYPETASTVYQQAASGANAALPSNGVQLGHQVDLTLDASGNISTVVVIPQVEGTVTSITSSVTVGSGVSATVVPAITISGVLVVANADSTLGPVTTYGGGYTAFSDIAVSDNATVHGLLLSANGVDYVQATYIAKQPTFTGTRITGTVAAFDSTSDTFTLGTGANTITVTATGATLLPASATIANGETVNVWSSGSLSSNAITANVIRVRKNTSVANTVLGVSGQISGYVSQADFVVNGVTVDASALTLPKDITALSNGLTVAVSGTVNASGTLVASRLHVYKSHDNAAPPVTLTGTISDFVSSASFTVRGVTVDASQSPTFDNGTSATNLAGGVFVTITGTVVNNTVVATAVHFPSVPAAAVVDLRASVVSFDSSSGALVIDVQLPGKQKSQQVTLMLGSSVSYVNGTVASLLADQPIEIHAQFAPSTSTLTVSTITILPPPPTNPVSGGPAVLLQGVVTAVTPTTGTVTSFVVHGLTINVGNATVADIMGGPVTLAVGDRVILYAQVGDNNVLTALKIQVVPVKTNKPVSE